MVKGELKLYIKDNLNISRYEDSDIYSFTGNIQKIDD